MSEIECLRIDECPSCSAVLDPQCEEDLCHRCETALFELSVAIGVTWMCEEPAYVM